MKLLILSCGTGEGHNSAARAVREAAEAAGDRCETADPVGVGSRRASRVVDSLYNETIRRAPELFGLVYRAGAAVEKVPGPSPVYVANAAGAEALGRRIAGGGYDAVISTHLYGLEMLTVLRRRGELAVPSWGVLTDYTGIPFFCETDVDGYFIPHADLADELVKKGIPRNRMFDTGIPVGRRFRSPESRAEARSALGLGPDERVYLVMTGGVGCGRAAEIARRIAAGEDENCRIFVLAGRNARLARRVRDLCGGDRRVAAVGFTDQVCRFMRAADVMLSKPGGLSSTEAAAVGVPLVHLLSVPGCETANGAFFQKRGLSLLARDREDAAKKALALAHDRARGREMVERQHRTIRADAAEKIVARIHGGGQDDVALDR